MTVLEGLLLGMLILCALTSVLAKRLVACVILYMAYSIVMSILWLLLESPDLAITEAAVGAGITSILLFITLRRIKALEGMEEDEKQKEGYGYDSQRRN